MLCRVLALGGLSHLVVGLLSSIEKASLLNVIQRLYAPPYASIWCMLSLAFAFMKNMAC